VVADGGMVFLPGAALPQENGHGNAAIIA